MNDVDSKFIVDIAHDTTNPQVMRLLGLVRQAQAEKISMECERDVLATQIILMRNMIVWCATNKQAPNKAAIDLLNGIDPFDIEIYIKAAFALSDLVSNQGKLHIDEVRITKAIGEYLEIKSKIYVEPE